MPVRAVDDKPSDTLVVVSEEGFWTGSSTLPHLHQKHSRALIRLVNDMDIGSFTSSSHLKDRLERWFWSHCND